MMLSTNEYDVRLAKRQQLIDIGILPYAARWDKDQTIGQLISHGSSNLLRSIEEILDKPKQTYSTAGRLMLKRISGKLAFAQLQDETGMIQLMFEHQHSHLLTKPTGDVSKIIGDSNKCFDYIFLDKFVEVGDRIGVKGELFLTHKGELTLFVSDYQLLSKALRPLGDKFHGIGEDQEKSYRQRYLDMIFNIETLHRMKFRSNFIKTLRKFYRSHDFVEIDCPVLIPSASGAAAKPFVTHHHDFDMDFYLRICNEIELKKATVGGLEKVFTIATNFRNEGSDPSHLQEFTMLEHQNVFRSFHEDMQFTEQMFDYLFEHLDISRIISIKDKNGTPKEIDFTTPRPKIDYVQGVNQASGLDITSYTIHDAQKLRSDIRAQGIEFEGMDQMGTMTLIDYLYKKVLRPTIAGPAFIYNYPSIIAPLARITDDDPNKCEKWQVVVNGWEIINSYGELVDPIRQRANFAEQSKAEEGGDTEATSADLEFVRVMEYGMPIQAGFGMGIDRVIALLTQQDNLRDVVMFPLMKPHILKHTGEDKYEDNHTPISLVDHINTKKDDIVLLHGYCGRPQKHWLPRLGYELEKLGYSVTIPELPHPDDIALDEKVDYLLQHYHFTEQTIIIGHSLGATVGLKLLEKIDTKIRGFLGVCGAYEFLITERKKNDQLYHNYIVYAEKNGTNIQRDYERIKKNIESGLILIAANDSKVNETTQESMANSLQLEYRKFNASFDHACGGFEPAILQLVKQFLESEKSNTIVGSNTEKNEGAIRIHVLPSGSFINEAKNLASKYLTSTLLHCKQVAHCMKYFAHKLGKNDTEQHYWYIVGLLHDVDRDAIDKNPELHLDKTLETILGELSSLSDVRTPEIITCLLNDIRSHYPEVYADEQYTLNSDLRKYLISIDELSGLMYAYARMRGGSFEGMEVSGVIKKIKDTKFAAGVSREHVRYCEKVLDIKLEDFIQDMIQALSSTV